MANSLTPNPSAFLRFLNTCFFCVDSPKLCFNKKHMFNFCYSSFYNPRFFILYFSPDWVLPLLSFIVPRAGNLVTMETRFHRSKTSWNKYSEIFDRKVSISMIVITEIPHHNPNVPPIEEHISQGEYIGVTFLTETISVFAYTFNLKKKLFSHVNFIKLVKRSGILYTYVSIYFSLRVSGDHPVEL